MKTLHMSAKHTVGSVIMQSRPIDYSKKLYLTFKSDSFRLGYKTISYSEVFYQYSFAVYDKELFSFSNSTERH